MRNDALSRHYDKLTAEERFQLVLEAKARGDTTELERLKRTCPTKTYSMSDAAYSDRYEWSELLVLVVALDLTLYLAKLEVAGAFAWVAPQLLEYAADTAVETYLDGVDVGAELAWAAAGRKGAPRWNAETESVIDGRIDSALAKGRAALSVLPRLSDNLVRDLATEARAVWDGFSHFCRAELGLPPETVLRAHFAPVLDRFERQREALDTAKPDPAKVEEYANVLTLGWRRRLGIESGEP
jgi:hypothetical protein